MLKARIRFYITWVLFTRPPEVLSKHINSYLLVLMTLSVFFFNPDTSIPSWPEFSKMAQCSLPGLVLHQVASNVSPRSRGDYLVNFP